MNMLIENGVGDVLLKVGLFVLVQALVYLILSKSSNLFSKSPIKRSHSFRPARSVSIRRFIAALSDLPAGGELSPSSSAPYVQEDSSSHPHNSYVQEDSSSHPHNS